MHLAAFPEELNKLIGSILQHVRLDELLAANAPLARVYLLKTELKEIWFAPSVREGAAMATLVSHGDR